jgi:hypothetical protein
MTIILSEETNAGRMTLDDFDKELITRGFDGVDQQYRYRYINWGYRTVARKAPFTWEQRAQDIALDSGDYLISLSASSSGADLNNFKSIEKVFISTDPYRRRLHLASDDEFFNTWRVSDLDAAAGRGTPTTYYELEGNIYILPPPSQPVVITVHYHQQPARLVNPDDVPITPEDLDEAIVEATLIKIHNRVGEFIQSDQARTDFAEIMDDELSNETLRQGEGQERTEPDNTWL